MKIKDIYPNGFYGLVQDRKGNIVYRTKGLFRDSVIDSVKTAAIAFWKQGDRLMCSVEDELGDWNQWYAIFDGKEFRRR